MKSPFQAQGSPIEQLYLRSRSKSQEIRLTSHSSLSKASSYRQFQVKMIRQALQSNHIISKQYGCESKKMMNRERLQSKYFGVESQRYKSPSFHQEHTATIFSFQKQNNFHLQSVNFKTYPDTQMYHLQTHLKVPPHKLPYENTEYMINHPHISDHCLNEDQVISSRKLLSKKKVESEDKKCSITQQLIDNEYGSIKHSFIDRKKQRKNMIQKVREQYYQQLSEMNSKEETLSTSQF